MENEEKLNDATEEIKSVISDIKAEKEKGAQQEKDAKNPRLNDQKKTKPDSGQPKKPDVEQSKKSDGGQTKKPVKKSQGQRTQGERKPHPNGQRRPHSPNDDRKRNPNRKRPTSKKKKWTKKKKAIVISSIIIASLLIVIGVIVLIIFRYINMMDIVTEDEDSFEILESIEPEPDDLKNSREDSPEDKKKALEEAIKKNLEANATELKSDDNVLNILLIGCDARSKSERGRSDSMILVSLNKNTKKVIMTSFLRDTWVEIPTVGQQRLNAAYVYGGPKLLIDTLQSNFGIRIDKYIRVNFYSFIEIIDAIGGVDIEVTDEELPYVQQYIRGQNTLIGKSVDANKLEKSGKQTLNGVQALAYARLRYVGTDFARTQRQRNVMNEVFRKAQEMSLTELNDFLEKALPTITTNLERGQIFSLILNASDYLKYERVQQSIPSLGSFENMVINGMMVLGIDFEKYSKELKESIYGS